MPIHQLRTEQFTKLRLLIETSKEKAPSNCNHSHQPARQHVAGPKKYQGALVKTPDTALDADRELFNSELDLAQTKRNELLSLVQLYKALGGGWQQ